MCCHANSTQRGPAQLGMVVCTFVPRPATSDLQAEHKNKLNSSLKINKTCAKLIKVSYILSHPDNICFMDVVVCAHRCSSMCSLHCALLKVTLLLRGHVSNFKIDIASFQMASATWKAQTKSNNLSGEVMKRVSTLGLHDSW